MNGFDVLSAFELLGALVAGLALGAAHFVTLRWVSLDYLGGRPARAFALQLVRMAIMVAALYGLARLGALDLLAGAFGVIAARFIVVRKARREP